MARNGGDVPLFRTVSGAGEPLVLVHGSWTDHHGWDAVAPALAERYTVIRYDRRGHGLSASAGSPTVHDHVTDLTTIIDEVGLGPVHVAASSYGASIALRTAALHPGLVRSLVVHEPPLFGTLDAGGPLAAALQELRERQGRVEALLRAGRMAEAARTFTDETALGPGTWERLPESVRDRFVRNAPTFLAEIDDPDALHIELAGLSAFRRPVLLSQGDRSPPLFAAVIERIARALPLVTRHTFVGAGHVPQLTHPREYVARVETFLSPMARLEPSPASPS